jgi:hypothetical protein
MTPKEKAQDIWMKLFQKQIEVTGSGDGNLCVEMALIAVDEIMYNNIMECPQHSIIYAPHKNDYWQEVKQEIEKL